MTRTFAAPRALVIKAMTTPELIKRWLGGKRSSVVSAEFEPRVGGTYRFVFGLPDGTTFSFSGVIKELSQDRIVHSEIFNDGEGESLVTTTYVEKDGITTMKVVVSFATQEIRDMVAATGMADGAGESYDELAKLLPTL